VILVGPAAGLGGDEFAILFPMTDEPQAEAAVTKIREKLLAGMQANGWPVTFSMGVATFADPPETIDAMIKIVDFRMYAAKNSGKDKIIYTDHS